MYCFPLSEWPDITMSVVLRVSTQFTDFNCHVSFFIFFFQENQGGADGPLKSCLHVILYVDVRGRSLSIMGGVTTICSRNKAIRQHNLEEIERRKCYPFMFFF